MVKYFSRKIKIAPATQDQKEENMPYYKPLNSEIGDGLGQTSLEKLMEDQRLTEKVRRGVPVSFNNNRLKAEGVERRLYAIEAEIKTALMQGKKVSVDCCDRQIKITIS